VPSPAACRSRLLTEWITSNLCVGKVTPSGFRPSRRRCGREGGNRVVVIMDRTVAHLNVEHYRKLLASETDEATRATILRLLADEEAKLAALGGNSTERTKAH
jgi:hypothetical protein